MASPPDPSSGYRAINSSWGPEGGCEGEEVKGIRRGWVIKIKHFCRGELLPLIVAGIVRQEDEVGKTWMIGLNQIFNFLLHSTKTRMKRKM